MKTGIKALTGAAAIIGLIVGSGAANAATSTYKFYNGTTGYTGAFNGVGTVYDATKASATDTRVSGTTDIDPGTDDIATSITYGGGTKPSVTATAGNNLVWQDLAPNFGGLGVGTTSTNLGDDQINGAEILTMTFSEAVTLLGVATLFYGDGTANHCCFGQIPGQPAGTQYTESSIKTNVSTVDNLVFDLSVDGGAFQQVKFSTANLLGLSLVGKVFSFKQDTGDPEFYVSGLSISSVPVPGAALLFASGLMGVGYLGRRNRLKAVNA
ncbi:MAG: hypothetical protein U1E46_18565 [Hyphomicrobiales bacterium]